MVGGLEHLFHMLGIMIPTDFHIFQRGSNHQPDEISWFYWFFTIVYSVYPGGGTWWRRVWCLWKCSRWLITGHLATLLTGAKRREWMGCCGLLGWLLVIMDHSRKFLAFSTSKTCLDACCFLVAVACLSYYRALFWKRCSLIFCSTNLWGQPNEMPFWPIPMWAVATKPLAGLMISWGIILPNILGMLIIQEREIPINQPV